jgi:tetratricopeptide (TPR) repeat protein
MPLLQKKKAEAKLTEALLLAGQSRWREAQERATEVVYNSNLIDERAYWVLAMAHHEQNEIEQMKQLLDFGLTKIEGPMLLGALGQYHLEKQQPEQALAYFERALKLNRRDPHLLTRCAEALLRQSRLEEAERQLAAALLVGGGTETRLILALAKASRGRFDEAESIAKYIEKEGKPEEIRIEGTLLRAHILLAARKEKEAHELYVQLDAVGLLQPRWCPEAAVAAARIRAFDKSANLILRAGPEAQLDGDAFLDLAQVAVLQGDAPKALGYFLRCPEVSFHSQCVGAAIYEALGEDDKALELARLAALRPESQGLGFRLFVLLARLEAQHGNAEAASAALDCARLIDPSDEAVQLPAPHTSNTEKENDIFEKASAEATDLKAQLEARELELEAMKREVEQLRKTQKKAEAQVLQERKKIEHAVSQKYLDERAENERDSDERAARIVQESIPKDCPEELHRLVLVAERTFQNALKTDIPAAAVAVLYSGALERSLLECIIKPFDEFLDAPGKRAEFLKASLRELKSGRKKEYFDRAVESFDRTLHGKAPGLGEMLRLIDRRNEIHLQVFRQWMNSALGLSAEQLDAMVEFVQWSKMKLRDPVAHGHLEVEWSELKTFRHTLLFEFASAPKGMLEVLISAKKNH